MDYQALKTHILESLAERFALHGFKYIKSKQAYVSTFPGGKCTFHIGIANYVSVHRFMSDVSIRHDAVEEKRHALNPKVSPEYRKCSTTVGTVLDFYNQEQLTFTATDEHDADLVIEGLYRVFMAHALPFFDRFTKLEEIYQFLIQETSPRSALCLLASDRSTNLLILATLLGKWDDVDGIIAREDARTGHDCEKHSKENFRLLADSIVMQRSA